MHQPLQHLRIDRNGRGRGGAAYAIADIPGAVGYVTPGATVEIVDDGDNVAGWPEGSFGIRPAQTVKGYVGDASEAETAFRDGWFYPGDIAALRADSMLIVLGRERSVLNLGGDKVRPELVEDAWPRSRPLFRGPRSPRPTSLGIARLWAAVARRRVDEEALRSHCAERLGAAFAPAVRRGGCTAAQRGRQGRPAPVDLRWRARSAPRRGEIVESFNASPASRAAEVLVAAATKVPNSAHSATVVRAISAIFAAGSGAARGSRGAPCVANLHLLTTVSSLAILARPACRCPRARPTCP